MVCCDTFELCIILSNLELNFFISFSLWKCILLRGFTAQFIIVRMDLVFKVVSFAFRLISEYIMSPECFERINPVCFLPHLYQSVFDSCFKALLPSDLIAFASYKHFQIGLFWKISSEVKTLTHMQSYNSYDLSFITIFK